MTSLTRTVLNLESRNVTNVMLPASTKAGSTSTGAQAWIEITEEPKSHDLRFRYQCEGRSAGSLQGVNSVSERKTYPAISIHGTESHVAIVVVSCVTQDRPYRPHPHNLVGQDCKDGVCTVKVKDVRHVTFPNIGIQCCKRNEVENSLKAREMLKVDPFNNYGSLEVNGNIDLGTVRLCFQVFLPDENRKFTRIVNPVVSQPIIDKKTIKDLKICRISRQAGQAGGDDEVYLLCEKINKDDIQIRFFEDTPDGVVWESFGDFTSKDIHRQCAIVFRTPPYQRTDIQKPVTVSMQLRRPSDDECGEPKSFQYVPAEDKLEVPSIATKRKREMNVVHSLKSMNDVGTFVTLTDYKPQKFDTGLRITASDMRTLRLSTLSGIKIDSSSTGSYKLEEPWNHPSGMILSYEQVYNDPRVT